MFRKIVSNLSFSPALVGQLGFYAKRLRKEESTRRLGLIFTALALVFQSFAVFDPPQSANAASTNDILYGGINSKSQMMSAYDTNKQNFRDLMNAAGVTRAELAGTSLTSVNSKNIPVSFGRKPHFSHAQGERSYTFPTASGTASTVYYKPLSLWDSKPYTKRNGSTYRAFGGNSAAAGQFWIILDCGNLALKKAPRTPPCPPGTVGTYPNCKKPEPPKCPPGTIGTPPNCTKPVQPKKPCPTNPALPFDSPNCKPCPTKPDLPFDSPECKPCPGTPDLWYKDEKCTSELEESKVAVNATQGGATASEVTARPSDQITYTVTVKNVGKADTTTTIEEHLSDVLEYAKILDNGGGSLNEETGILSWPNVTVKAGQAVSRVFSVKVNDAITAMPAGQSNPTSYDCKMVNTFGNSVEIGVECPVEKEVVETITTELPHTGATENMIFAGVLATIVVYFYTRSRQLKTEVRLIRRDFNAGTI